MHLQAFFVHGELAAVSTYLACCGTVKGGMMLSEYYFDSTRRVLWFFLELFSSKDCDRDGGYGQVSLCSGGGKAWAFAELRHSSAVLLIYDFTKIVTGRLKQSMFRSRLVNVAINEVDPVHCSLLRS